MQRNLVYSAHDFFNKLGLKLAESKIKLKEEWIIDHICYRTKDEAEYTKVVDDFARDNLLLIESIVGGRLISTFKLKVPYKFEGFSIPLIEIPAPKEGRISQSGFEHIEIVVKESFEELISMYSHLNLKTHALSKTINPELEVELDDIAIKFHHQSLEEVIEYEKSLV